MGAYVSVSVSNPTLISSGVVQGFFGNRSIASGTVGVFDFGSGAVIAGTVGSGAIRSGNIGSGQVGGKQIASGAITSGLLGVSASPDGTKFLRDDFSWQNISILSGVVGSGTVASGAVQGFFGTTRNVSSGTIGSFDFGSGAVVAGAVGSGAIVSGNIASGQIGRNHLGSGAVGSGAISSGQIGAFHISSGAVDGFFGPHGNLLSGTVGAFDFASGAVIAGTVGSGAIVSGNIGSGQVGRFHHSSGSVTSGVIGVNAISAPDGTKFLRDDYNWQVPIANAGGIGSGAVVSGSIASGQIGPNHFGSGVVLSGAIASGQIGTNHISSGTQVSYSENVRIDTFLTAEIVSGVRAVQIDPTLSGFVRIAMAAVSGRMPAIGVAFENQLSGQAINIVRYGVVTAPISEVGSGYALVKAAAASPFQGRSLFLGASGAIITFTAVAANLYVGVGSTNSGAWAQKLGHNVTSGSTLLIDPSPRIIASGAAIVGTNSLIWPV